MNIEELETTGHAAVGIAADCSLRGMERETGRSQGDAVEIGVDVPHRNRTLRGLMIAIPVSLTLWVLMVLTFRALMSSR
jgi:hypothetical protein